MTEDRRNIDPALGTLEGEGSAQVVGPGAPDIDFEVWNKTPSDVERDPATYYERPILKEPVWIWAVPAYFFAGGAAGAAATLGAAAQAVDRDSLRDLVRACRRIAASGTLVGTGLLIYDLGRPKRFLNMLRVLRVTSPLSIGSWILAFVTPLSAASALLSESGGAAKKLGDLAGYGAGIAGMPLAGYTAVLLSNTVVPVWREARRTLPLLFVASAASSASSLLDLMELGPRERRITDRFGVIGATGELLAAVAVQREVSRNEAAGRPLREGLSGTLWKAATALGVAGLALSLPGRPSRPRRIASAVLGVGGALTMRFAIFHAGRASAREPRATMG